MLFLYQDQYLYVVLIELLPLSVFLRIHHTNATHCPNNIHARNHIHANCHIPSNIHSDAIYRLVKVIM